MSIVVVVNKLEDFQAEIPGIEIITARTYLTDERFIKLKGAKIFNLCRTYRYQSTGYYVSLLAAARGHKAIPDIVTIQDTKSQSIVKVKSDDLEEHIQKDLADIDAAEFTLSIYFGKNIEDQFKTLSSQLFSQFRAPLLRAFFSRQEQKWKLDDVELISISEIPDDHFPDFISFAKDFFNTKRFTVKKPVTYQHDLAILINPDDPMPPSNEMAIKKFIKAAESFGIGAYTITKEDYSHIAEYDALFIRETTAVNHYTYRFARRAMVEGLVVIDDPESILKCCNKVYLAEVLNHHNILTPKTLVFNKDTINILEQNFKFPFILKQPDSAFSQGVMKANNREELHEKSQKMFEKSELLIAQEFLPSEYDWRIGIIDQQPIYACKYYMADNHWQIINSSEKGDDRFGKDETFDWKDVPDGVIQTAIKAANLIGKGLYGVDLKEINQKTYVIEVNDNPSIDAGVEDKILKDMLYTKVMEVFAKRIQKLKSR